MRQLSRALALVVVQCLAITVTAACIFAQTPAREPRATTVAELKASPDRFVEVEVVVTGKLVAEGNYFSRSRRTFLAGANGQQIEVLPWLPLSAPPPRSDTDKGPATLADFLDQTVELRGMLRRTPGDTTGPHEPYRFTVRSARIVPPKASGDR
jgi:hypothetical protein